MEVAFITGLPSTGNTCIDDPAYVAESDLHIQVPLYYSLYAISWHQLERIVVEWLQSNHAFVLLNMHNIDSQIWHVNS